MGVPLPSTPGNRKHPFHEDLHRGAVTEVVNTSPFGAPLLEVTLGVTDRPLSLRRGAYRSGVSAGRLCTVDRQLMPTFQTAV